MTSFNLKNKKITEIQQPEMIVKISTAKRGTAEGGNLHKGLVLRCRLIPRKTSMHTQAHCCINSEKIRF